PVPSVPACAPPSPDTLSLHDALPISIVTGAALGYGLLFVIGPSDDPHAHHQHAAPAGAGFEAHLYGMYVALVLAAGLIGYFVSRLSGAMRERERELAATRARAAQAERLAALATGCAGA